jgi:hypothetical protein
MTQRRVVMAETREITLTEENWQRIDELFAIIPNSDFLRFCLINDILELSLGRLEDQLTSTPEPCQLTRTMPTTKRR